MVLNSHVYQRDFLKICTDTRKNLVLWSWSKDLLLNFHFHYMTSFVWRKHQNMSHCNGSPVITNYEWFASCAWTGFDRGPQSLKASPPSAIRLSVLANLSWSVSQTYTGASHMVSHTWHNNELTLSKNDSPLGCLHLALAFGFNCVTTLNIYSL